MRTNNEKNVSFRKINKEEGICKIDNCYTMDSKNYRQIVRYKLDRQ